MRRAILIFLALVVLWPAAVMGGVDYRATGTSDYTVTFYSGTAVRSFSIMPFSADIEVILLLDSVALDTVTVLAQMVWEPTILCDQITVIRTSSTAVLCDWNEFLSRDVAQARKSYGLPGGIITSDGLWLDPDLTTVTVLTGEDIGETESVLVNLGDISGYKEVYVKLLATTWQDSLVCKFGSSETLGWATGNTAYFDFVPSDAAVDHWSTGTDVLSTYGTIIPLRDAYGAWMPGKYGVLEIENNNIVWDDATDNDLLGVTVIVIKRK